MGHSTSELFTTGMSCDSVWRADTTNSRCFLVVSSTTVATTLYTRTSRTDRRVMRVG
jgi:hypothetical protein